MKIDIFNDGKGYATNEASTVRIVDSNTTEENRIKFVTDLAAVSRGNAESKNPPSRYRQLLKEAAPTDNSIKNYLKDKEELIDGNDRNLKAKGSPSRPLEFLPVVMRIIFNRSETKYDILLCSTDDSNEVIAGFYHEDFSNKIGKYSYIKNGLLYTNMRALLNAGIPYSYIPYNTSDELTEFKAIKAKIPMFIWAQVPNTHTAISKEAQSDRVTSQTDYWLPHDFRNKTYDYVTKYSNEHGEPLTTTIPNFKFYNIAKVCLSFENKDDIIKYLLTGGRDGNHSLSQNETVDFFSSLGYPLEISQRALYYFKYKEVVMTGWNIDPNVWQHLFVERSTEPDIWKNWTQKETIKVVEAFKTLVND